MLIQREAGDIDVIRDNISLDFTATVCTFERLIRVLEGGGGLWTEVYVIALGGGKC